MTSHPRFARTFCALILAVLVAAPLFAAGKAKQRAVAPPKAEKTTISGTVTDAITGQPLQSTFITSNGMTAVTDTAGHYSMTCTLTSDVTATRQGYLPVKKPVNSTQIDFALPQGPAVTVKLTNGQTIVFDYDSTKLGYADVFQYVSDERINLCKSGGTAWLAHKSEFAKFFGPAHPVTDDTCCTRGPIMAIDIQTKDGQRSTTYITDSCFGIVYDILGVERSSLTPKYLHLADVSEVTFP